MTDSPLESQQRQPDPNDIVDIINQQEIQNYKLGIILLVIALATWIIGLELVNAVLKEMIMKTLVIAVITGSCFSINLLPDIILLKHWEVFGQTQIEEDFTITSNEIKRKNEDVSELTPRKCLFWLFKSQLFIIHIMSLGCLR